MLEVLALQQVLFGKVEGVGKWPILVELSPLRGPLGRAERHHIASNECLWENVRHHHAGSLLRPDSRYQIESATEGQYAALQHQLLTKTSSKLGRKAALLDPQVMTGVEMQREGSTACLWQWLNPSSAFAKNHTRLCVGVCCLGKS